MSRLNLSQRELEQAATVLGCIIHHQMTGKRLDPEAVPPELARAQRDFVRRLQFTVVGKDGEEDACDVKQ